MDYSSNACADPEVIVSCHTIDDFDLNYQANAETNQTAKECQSMENSVVRHEDMPLIP